MKKVLSCILSVVLCLCMFMPAVYAAEINDNIYDSVAEYVADAGSDSAKLRKKAETINKVTNFLINDVAGKLLKHMFPDNADIVRKKNFDINSYEGFYPGMEKFINTPVENARWHLGYGSASVIPENFGEKLYAKGAYLPNIYGNEMYKDDEGEDEDLRARAIIMDDGSGRGKVVFIAIDCMGLCNADVRLIRENLAEFAKDNNIVSINVSATHIHTGIDSQGVWTDPLKTILRNSLSLTAVHGVDRDFIASLLRGTEAAVKQAATDMKTGELYYTRLDAGRYFNDRKQPEVLDPNIYKLEFRPDNENARPTIIASFGCHPESSSYDWQTKDSNGKMVFDKKFSADLVWYMEKLMNKAGYNFIYIQGNVSVVNANRSWSNDELAHDAHMTAVRLGYELGYVTLTASMTRDDRIKVNSDLGDKLGIKEYGEQKGYTPWYDGLDSAPEKKVQPYLNVAHRQFLVEIENNLMAAIGRTGVSDNKVIKEGCGTYYTVTEVGYLQIGDGVRVFLSPGETYSYYKFGGPGMDGCSVKCINETLGDDVIICDLVNDAAGYMSNEKLYVMAGYEYSESQNKLKDTSWGLISYGQHTGSTVIKNFYELVDSVK